MRLKPQTVIGCKIMLAIRYKYQISVTLKIFNSINLIFKII